MRSEQFTIYALSISYQIELAAHSLSNSGTSSIRLLPRQQLLADGTVVDALSGNINKHYHNEILIEYLTAMGISLCPACARGDGRRVAALINEPGYEDVGIDQILRECASCDTHGFLVTAKNATTYPSEEKDKLKNEEASSKSELAHPARSGRGKAKHKDMNELSTEMVGSSLTENAGNKGRKGMSKHSLIEYSFGLALPDSQAETPQLFTRQGNEKGEQMLIKRSGRSGSYGMCVRYKCVGVGVDTDKWKVIVTDENERTERHRAILLALRDCILSPSGAVTATMLPHVRGLRGTIVVQHKVGKVPYYSPLDSEFIDKLVALENSSRRVLTFESVDRFSTLMDDLIESSRPALPTTMKPKSRSNKVIGEIGGQD